MDFHQEAASSIRKRQVARNPTPKLLGVVGCRPRRIDDTGRHIEEPPASLNLRLKTRELFGYTSMIIQSFAFYGIILDLPAPFPVLGSHASTLSSEPTSSFPQKAPSGPEAVLHAARPGRRS